MKRNISAQVLCILLVLIILTAAIAGCGRIRAGTPYEDDMKSYASVIESLPAGSYYAFADMSQDHDALLVTDHVFDNLDGTLAAVEATVYGFDKYGSIKEYGTVKSGGTANPLAVKDSELYCAHHQYIDKVRIEEYDSQMITDEGDYFEDYGDTVVIAFTQVKEKAG